VAPSPGGALGTAGLSRGGERRTGLLLAQEGHCVGSCLRGKDTKGHTQRSLGSCLRRNDTCWISACAGITLWPPHPAVPWAPPASPAVGRGVLDCCLRRNDTGGLMCHSRPPCMSFPPSLCVIPAKAGIPLVTVHGVLAFAMPAGTRRQQARNCGLKQRVWPDLKQRSSLNLEQRVSPCQSPPLTFFQNSCLPRAADGS